MSKNNKNKHKFVIEGESKTFASEGLSSWDEEEDDADDFEEKKGEYEEDDDEDDSDI